MKIISHQSQPLDEWRTGVTTRMHVSALNGASQLCTFEQWIASGVGAPTHYHPVEEVLTVITGEAEMWVDEKRIVLTGGQSVIVPARRKHGFRNIGSAILHINAVLASASFEAMFDSGLVRRWHLSEAGDFNEISN